MLGIVIGVASVIALMSIGKGAQAAILENIQGMGSDLITISPGAFTFGGVRGGSSQTLTLEDSEAIAEQISYINAVSASNSSNLQLVYGGENTNSSVTGVTPDYKEVRNLECASGAFFTEYEYQRGTKVAVLGSNIKETLFGDTDPLGEKLRMGSIVVTVIGVLESEGGFMGPDDTIYIPLSAMQQAVAQRRTAQGERVVSSIFLPMTTSE